MIATTSPTEAATAVMANIYGYLQFLRTLGSQVSISEFRHQTPTTTTIASTGNIVEAG